MQVSDEYIIMASIVCPTATEAAARLNMSLATYKKYALRLGCYHTAIGFKTRKEFTDKFNDKYFDVIDSDEKAYFLGYIAADGCVSGNKLSFCINRKDKSILVLLCGKLGCDVKYVKDFDYDYITDKGESRHFSGCRLSLHSWHLTESLRQYNVVERKSYVDVDLFKKVPFNFGCPWLVGFLDGDGSILWNNHSGCTVSFLGNQKTIRSIQLFLTRVFHVTDGYLSIRKSLYCLKYGMKSDNHVLLTMYCFASSIHLSRKFEVAMKCLCSYAKFGNFRNHMEYISGNLYKVGIEKKKKIENHCVDCGKVISPNAVRCVACDAKFRCLNCQRRPDREVLISILKEVKNFKKIGEFYGVSDNAVRKWCKYYELPFRTTDLRQMTNEDWSKYEVN